jgi:hypothetical protein
MNIETTAVTHDLLLEVIGEIKDFTMLAGVRRTDVWRDARIGDYSLRIELETPQRACTVLQSLREMGLTPVGARLVEPRVTPIIAARAAHVPMSVPQLELACV